VTLLAAVGATAREQPAFAVRRPTIVAFFPPVTQAELDQDADTNETLADFQLYAPRSQTAPRSRRRFLRRLCPVVQIRHRNQITTFRPDDGQEGYYFIAPGKKPRIEYGVCHGRRYSGDCQGVLWHHALRIPPSMRAGSVTTAHHQVQHAIHRDSQDAERQQQQPDDGYSTSATSASGQQKNSRTAIA